MNKKGKVFILAIILISIFIGKCNTVKASFISNCVYFYSPTCSSCIEIEKEIKEVYPSNNKIIMLDVSDKKNLNTFFQFCESYGVDESNRSLPMMFLGKDVYTTEDSIFQCLKDKVVLENNDSLLVDTEVTNEYVTDKSTKLSIFYLLVAGLIDGINPCAIAMLLLLISLLGFTNEKNKIVKISCSFISGIFISYYLIGVLLYSFVSVVDLSYVGKIIKWIIVIFCTILCVLNLRDAVKAKKEEYQNVLLQLPKSVKKFNKFLMKKVISLNEKPFVYVIFFVLGIVISFTEFMCTGQVYLPVILLLSQVDNPSSLSRYFNFFIYNLAFVLPLVVVSLIAIKKNAVVSVSSSFVEKMHIIKFINAIFYFLVAFVVLFFMIF